MQTIAVTKPTAKSARELASGLAGLIGPTKIGKPVECTSIARSLLKHVNGKEEASFGAEVVGYNDDGLPLVCFSVDGKSLDMGADAPTLVTDGMQPWEDGSN